MQFAKNFWFRQKTPGTGSGSGSGAGPQAFIGLIKRKCLRLKRAQVGLTLSSSSSSSSPSCSPVQSRFRFLVALWTLWHWQVNSRFATFSKRCSALILESFFFSYFLFFLCLWDATEARVRPKIWMVFHLTFLLKCLLVAALRPATWFDFNSFWLLGRRQRLWYTTLQLSWQWSAKRPRPPRLAKFDVSLQHFANWLTNQIKFCQIICNLPKDGRG